MKALSVRQPWAWLLFHGKPVENRDWVTGFRGRMAIAASAGMTKAEYQEAVEFVRSFDAGLAARIPHPDLLARGSVIGTVVMVDVVFAHSSPFFVGGARINSRGEAVQGCGHVYEDAREFGIPIPAKGALGLWEWRPPRPLEEIWVPRREVATK